MRAFCCARAELEQLIGVITLADLGEALRVAATRSRAPLARPPLHVPSSVSLLRLLELFREASVHLAVVTGRVWRDPGLGHACRHPESHRR